MPTKTWISGESLIAADMNSYLQNQVVSTWSNVAARNAAIIVPTVGMMSFLNDVQALQIYVGTAWKSLPYGFLGMGQITASVGGIGAVETLVAGMSATINVPAAGRRIKLSQRAVIYTVSGGRARMQLWEGSTKLQQAFQETVSSAQTFATMHNEVIVTPSAGTHTYDSKFFADTGSLTVFANPDMPAHLMAEDIGA